jgi:hypothetical protein
MEQTGSAANSTIAGLDATTAVANYTFKGWPPTSPVVLVIALTNLPSNLTGGEGCGVDVSIGGIRKDGRHERVEITRCHTLRDRPDYACGYNRPLHRSAIQRAGLGSRRRSEGRVRAEEHHNATRNVHLAEVDVRLRNRRTQPRICQLKANRLVDPIDVQQELPLSWGKYRTCLSSPKTADFLKSGERGKELLFIVVIICIPIRTEQQERCCGQASRGDEFESHVAPLFSEFGRCPRTKNLTGKHGNFAQGKK